MAKRFLKSKNGDTCPKHLDTDFVVCSRMCESCKYRGTSWFIHANDDEHYALECYYDGGDG